MTPERRAELLASDGFACLATDAYFANPAWLEDLDLAREHGKPITFLLKRGTRVPPGAFKGVSQVFEWDTVDELAEAMKLMQERVGQPMTFQGHALPTKKPRPAEAEPGP